MKPTTTAWPTRFLFAAALIGPCSVALGKNWTQAPLEEVSVTMPKARFSISVPVGTKLDERFLKQNMADWKAVEGKSWEGPSVSVSFQVFPPRDLEAAKTDATGILKLKGFDLAESTTDGYELVLETTGSSLQAIRYRPAGGKMLRCRASIPLGKAAPDRASAARWLRRICESMKSTGAGAGGDGLSSANSAGGTGAGSRFRDPSTGLQLSLASGWLAQNGGPGEPVQLGSSAAALKQGPGPDRAAAMLFTGTVQQMGRDPNSLVDRFMAKTTNNAADVSPASSLRIGGRPAARANWTGMIAGVKATYSIYAVIGEKHTVLLMGVDGSGGRKLSEISEIAQSIKVE